MLTVHEDDDLHAVGSFGRVKVGLGISLMSGREATLLHRRLELAMVLLTGRQAEVGDHALTPERVLAGDLHLVPLELEHVWPGFVYPRRRSDATVPAFAT